MTFDGDHDTEMYDRTVQYNLNRIISTVPGRRFCPSGVKKLFYTAGFLAVDVICNMYPDHGQFLKNNEFAVFTAVEGIWSRRSAPFWHFISCQVQPDCICWRTVQCDSLLCLLPDSFHFLYYN